MPALRSAASLSGVTILTRRYRGIAPRPVPKVMVMIAPAAYVSDGGPPCLSSSVQLIRAYRRQVSFIWAAPWWAPTTEVSPQSRPRSESCTVKVGAFTA